MLVSGRCCFRFFGGIGTVCVAGFTFGGTFVGAFSGFVTFVAANVSAGFGIAFCTGFAGVGAGVCAFSGFVAFVAAGMCAGLGMIAAFAAGAFFTVRIFTGFAAGSFFAVCTGFAGLLIAAAFVISRAGPAGSDKQEQDADCNSTRNCDSPVTQARRHVIQIVMAVSHIVRLDF